jgi:hypothetical protein
LALHRKLESLQRVEVLIFHNLPHTTQDFIHIFLLSNLSESFHRLVRQQSPCCNVLLRTLVAQVKEVNDRCLDGLMKIACFIECLKKPPCRCIRLVAVECIVILAGLAYRGQPGVFCCVCPAYPTGSQVLS